MKTLAPFLLSLFSTAAALGLSGCSDPVKNAQMAEKEASKASTGITLPKTPVKGQELNAFFPKSREEFTVVFSQEKAGFSLADLKDKTGAGVAQLTIADLVTNPEALAKYVGVTEKVGGYPVVKSGDTGTAILVGNQFQVQVRSQKASEEQRRLLIQTVDLAGLAKKSQAKGTLGAPAPAASGQ